MKILAVFLLFITTACSSAPKFEESRIRPWAHNLEIEYQDRKPVIAHYKNGEYELFYLAASHTNKIGEPTLNLVHTLFDKFRFNLLIIESIPNSSGESL